MSNSIRIFTGKEYCLDSYGNGWAYAITRLKDGAVVWVQDSEAVIFSEEMERTDDNFTLEDLCFIVFNYPET